MPRYFYNWTKGASTFLDSEGITLTTPDEARERALDISRKLLGEHALRFEWRMWVTDEVGGLVYALEVGNGVAGTTE
jgi:hypothetical protein